MENHGNRKHGYMVNLDAISDIFHNGETHAKYIPVTEHEPIESIDKSSIYHNWMKLYKDDVYGKSVK